MPMDDKLKRRFAGAAVLLAAAFVIVSLLPTPEQAAQQPDVDVVTIPLREVVRNDPPPPPAAEQTPPTLARPDESGEGQEFDISGDDDGGEPEASKPVQIAQAAPVPAPAPKLEAKPVEKPAAKPAEKPAPKPAEVTPPTKAADKPAAATTDKPASTPAKPADKPAEKPSQPAVVAAKPAETPAAKPADKPAEKTADKPSAGGNWSVQVGGFSDLSRAHAVQDKIKAMGLSSFISPLDSANGTLYRVRVGPFGSREAAQAALGKLNGNGFPDARLVAP